MTEQFAVKSIEVEYDPESLWGDESPETQGLDVQATIDAYSEGLVAQLKRAYPDASIEVTATESLYQTKRYVELTPQIDSNAYYVTRSEHEENVQQIDEDWYQSGTFWRFA